MSDSIDYKELYESEKLHNSILLTENNNLKMQNITLLTKNLNLLTKNLKLANENYKLTEESSVHFCYSLVVIITLNYMFL
jgi:hypothetical protein